MGLFGSLGGAVDSIFGGGKTPHLNSGTWNRPLNEAKNLWSDARAQETKRLQEHQAATMAQFAPYQEQLQGMATPYGQAGLAGLQGFQGLMANPASIMADPFYQAKLAAGQGAIENSAAARGMQLSGANLQNLGNFGAELAADTFGQRLAQFQQQQQMGQQGLFGGLQGLGNIAGIGLNFDQLLNQANYQGIGGMTDVLGAKAQANSAAQIGKMNAQAQTQSGLFGALGSLGGMALTAGPQSLLGSWMGLGK